jgi:hypothetical protein
MAGNCGTDTVTVHPVNLPGELESTSVALAITSGTFGLFGSRDNVSPLIHVPRLIGAMILSGDSMLASGHHCRISGSDTARGEQRSRASYVDLSRFEENHGRGTA